MIANLLVLTASLAVLDDDGVVRVSDPSGRASSAKVHFELPVAGSWKTVRRVGEGLAAHSEWTEVGNGCTIPWYALVADGRTTYGYGVKVQAKAMCSWRIAPDGIDLLLDLRAGGQPLELGSRTLEACTVVRMRSSDGESPFAFGRRFCAAMCPSPLLPATPLYGFNDWYAAYGRNTATNFLADAAFIVSCARGLRNRPYVVMDDGWQRYSPPEVEKLTGKFDSGFGPWEESSPAFGMDMKAFCAKIVALDAKPGLWYRPLCMKGEFCDPSDPETVARIQSDIRRFRDWGFKLVKIDYLTYDFCGHFKGVDADGRLIRDDRVWKVRTRTTAETMVGLYRAIRTAAGDEMVLLGCNAVNHLCAGIFEASRVGSDTSGKSWEQTRRNGVGAIAFKGIENGTLFAADPDCAGLASAGAIPWEKNSQWIDLLGRSGMPCFVSWRRNLADAAVRAKMTEAFARASVPQSTAEPVGWEHDPTPEHWKTMAGDMVYDWQ